MTQRLIIGTHLGPMYLDTTERSDGISATLTPVDGPLLVRVRDDGIAERLRRIRPSRGYARHVRRRKAGQ